MKLTTSIYRMLPTAFRGVGRGKACDLVDKIAAHAEYGKTPSLYEGLATEIGDHWGKLAYRNDEFGKEFKVLQEFEEALAEAKKVELLRAVVTAFICAYRLAVLNARRRAKGLGKVDKRRGSQKQKVKDLDNEQAAATKMALHLVDRNPAGHVKMLNPTGRGKELCVRSDDGKYVPGFLSLACEISREIDADPDRWRHLKQEKAWMRVFEVYMYLLED